MVESAEHAVATSPLLEAKLYIPKWRTGLVTGAKLIERLVQGAERKLTLASAPAGFGKSTVLDDSLLHRLSLHRFNDVLRITMAP